MRAVCSANLRGVGQSLRMYSERHDGYYPPNLETLLESGQTTPRQLQCPFEANSDETSYDIQYLSGLTSDSPKDWIIAYENLSNHDNEGGHMLYLDERVEFVKEPEFSRELERVRRAMREAGIDKTP